MCIRDSFWDTNSYGSWSKTPFVIGFHHDNMQDQTINDRYDLRNCCLLYTSRCV